MGRGCQREKAWVGIPVFRLKGAFVALGKNVRDNIMQPVSCDLTERGCYDWSEIEETCGCY